MTVTPADQHARTFQFFMIAADQWLQIHVAAPRLAKQTLIAPRRVVARGLSSLECASMPIVPPMSGRCRIKREIRTAGERVLQWQRRRQRKGAGIPPSRT